MAILGIGGAAGGAAGAGGGAAAGAGAAGAAGGAAATSGLAGSLGAMGINAAAYPALTGVGATGIAAPTAAGGLGALTSGGGLATLASLGGGFAKRKSIGQAVSGAPGALGNLLNKAPSGIVGESPKYLQHATSSFQSGDYLSGIGSILRAREELRGMGTRDRRLETFDNILNSFEKR
jgi:hypothetical protein